MLKRGVVTFVFRSREKALELCDKGNWILYFIFNSIHLFHEKLNVKHLDGHCREIFCFFFSKRKQYLHHFEGLQIFYLYSVTKTRIAPECPHGRCQNGHSRGRKCFTLWSNFFFPENSGLQKGKKVFLRILFKTAYFWVADKLLKLLYLKLFCSLILRFNSTHFVKSKAKQNFDEKK